MAKLTGVSIEEAAGQVRNLGRLGLQAVGCDVKCALDLFDGQRKPHSNAGFTADI